MALHDNLPLPCHKGRYSAGGKRDLRQYNQCRRWQNTVRGTQIGCQIFRFSPQQVRLLRGEHSGRNTTLAIVVSRLKSLFMYDQKKMTDLCSNGNASLSGPARPKASKALKAFGHSPIALPSKRSAGSLSSTTAFIPTWRRLLRYQA